MWIHCLKSSSESNSVIRIRRHTLTCTHTHARTDTHNPWIFSLNLFGQISRQEVFNYCSIMVCLCVYTLKCANVSRDPERESRCETGAGMRFFPPMCHFLSLSLSLNALYPLYSLTTVTRAFYQPSSMGLPGSIIPRFMAHLPEAVNSTILNKRKRISAVKLS